MKGETENHPSYGLFSAPDFLAQDWPARKPLMAPWLLSSSFTMLYASAGVGKTNFALGLALALARGEPFLGFSPPEPVRVMYVDAEMPAEEMQRRLVSMSNGQPLPAGLYILNKAAASRHYRLPSLSTVDGRDMLEKRLDELEVQLLILDNKSTLMSNSRENEAGSFDALQDWIMLQRGLGLAVMLLHHAGKNGTQRGSSQHDVTPDVILELFEPDGAPPAEGSHFVLRAEKLRHLPPQKFPQQLVTLTMSPTHTTWQHQPYAGGRKIDPRRAQALAMLESGKSQRAVAKELKVSNSTISDWAKAEASVRCAPALGEPNTEHPFTDDERMAA